jgi:hypothetical protein
MGGFKGMTEQNVLNEKFFDLTVRIANYAIEFGNTEGYVPIRIVDILKGLLELIPYIEGISKKEFYHQILEKIESRDILVTGEDRVKFLDELLEMLIKEWSKSIQ